MYLSAFFLYIQSELMQLQIVFFKFKQISLSEEFGLMIRSDFLFSGEARKFFPWTWITVYNLIFRFLIPAFMTIVMLCKTEAVGTKLDKFKSYVYALGVVLMWVVAVFLEAVIQRCPVYSLLHNIIFIPVLVIIPLGSRLAAAPSGRGTVSFIIKSLFMYILPAGVMGMIFMILFPLRAQYPVLFVFCGFVAAGFVLYFVQTAGRLIAKSKFGHSADYAVAFEKDLA